VAGALQPKRHYSELPKSLSNRKRSFLLSSGWIFICQYPLFRSKVENHEFPDSRSSISSIRGIEESFTGPLRVLNRV